MATQKSRQKKEVRKFKTLAEVKNMYFPNRDRESLEKGEVSREIFYDFLRKTNHSDHIHSTKNK